MSALDPDEASVASPEDEIVEIVDALALLEQLAALGLVPSARLERLRVERVTAQSLDDAVPMEEAIERCVWPSPLSAWH